MTFFCRNDSLSLAEKTTHFRNSSLNDHNSSFFQTEPFFKNPSAEPLKKIKKKANSKKFYSLCKPKAMPSYENSPFKINRLKPLILYNKEENMNRCYSVTKSFSSVKYKNEEVERREIEKKLRDKSDNHICEDEKPKDYIGEKAIIKYKEFYKNLDKILAENSSYGIKNSLLTEMLSRLEKKTLLPLKMGVIKLKGKSNELNLKHYKMGDKYGIIISESLKGRSDLQKIDFSDNKLRSISASQIFHNLNKNTRKINLSNNLIGKLGCESLAHFMMDKKNMLNEVNLEDNKLNDNSVADFLRNLKTNFTIRKLNLSNNQLTDHSAKLLKEVLKNNDCLTDLNIHWNQIQGSGGYQIFEGLLQNDSLKVLDLSWNALGSNYSELAKKIGSYFQNEKKFLVHLDLSFNNFNIEESKIMQKHLTENHNLFGFHFRGNYGYIDQKGFLIIPDDFEKEAMLYFAPKHRINGVKAIKKYIGDYSFKYKDHCWICAGWQECTFTFNIDQISDLKLENCFIHIDLEDWKPVPMEKISNKTFMLKKMCPRGRVKFFFSVNQIQIVSEVLPTLIMEDPLISYQFMEGNISIKTQLNVEEVNYIDIISENDVINELTFSPLIKTVPRKQDLKIETKKLIQVDWSLSESCFVENRNDDDDDLIGRCFEFDYDNSKIKKFVKSSEEEVELKTFLKSIYRKAKQIYHYLAALDPHGNILCISQNTLTDFVKQANLIDQKYLKFSEIDLSYVSAYAPLLKFSNEAESVNGRYLIRCQFMEMIIRLANDRYLKHGLEHTLLDATKAVVNKHLFPFFENYDYTTWREKRLWNLECDKILKHFWQFLQFLYKKYASKFVTNIFGMNSFKMMYLLEFRRIFQDSNLLDDFFTERDANLAFSMSIKYYENEITIDRCLQLSFSEFLEAFAKAAEKISTYPVGITDKSEWPLAKRLSLSLYIKLEGLIVFLMNKFLDKNMKEMIGIPKKSIFEAEIESILDMSPNRIRGPIRNSFVVREDLKGNTFKEKLKKSLNLSVMLNKVSDIINIKKN